MRLLKEDSSPYLLSTEVQTRFFLQIRILELN
jgi:hypothetical protein